MDRVKRNFIFEMIGFFSSLTVLLMSASSMLGKVSNAALLGLIAGSFGAGASLVNTVRNRAAGRKTGK